jgi:hypothetical protein
MKKLMIAIMACCFGTGLFAQDIEDFFADNGAYELSKFTHPDYKHKIGDIDIDINGSTIIVEITYDGRFLDFTDKYKFRISNGSFESMSVLEDGSAIGAFSKWLISSNVCDDESVNSQKRCAMEQCLEHLNRELSSFL